MCTADLKFIDLNKSFNNCIIMLIDGVFGFYWRRGLVKAVTRLKRIVLLQYFFQPFALEVWLGFGVEHLLHDLDKAPVGQVFKQYTFALA